MSFGQHSVMITIVKANSLLKGFHCDRTGYVVQGGSERYCAVFGWFFKCHEEENHCKPTSKMK